MVGGARSHQVKLATERNGVLLQSLDIADAAAFCDLLQGSAERLSRFGDYTSSVTQSVDHWTEEFSASDPRLNFAIRENGVMVGRAELNPVEPPRFGCGYLLAESTCGRGLATLALGALVRHARDN